MPESAEQSAALSALSWRATVSRHTGLTADFLNMDTEDLVEVGDYFISESSSYEVKKFLGCGSYGNVSLCHKNENEVVALKVVEDDGYEERETRILRMLRETDSAQHHIIKCVDSFKYNGFLCHEFEKLDKDLFEFLNTRPHRCLQLRDVRPIITQIAKALLFLKTQGIVHGDLKPSNVMMVDCIKHPLEIKVIDFGFALPVREVRTGSIMQTFPFRAPEVFVGAPMTEAIDMWSLGCIAAELFMGKLLFEPEDDYDMMRHINHIVGEPPKYVLDGGQHTHQYFHRAKRSSGWKFMRKDCSSLFTVENMDNINTLCRYQNDRVSSKAMKEDRRLFVQILKGILDPNPLLRFTPEDVLSHPFITMTHLKTGLRHQLKKSNIIMAQGLRRSEENEQPSTSACPKQREAPAAAAAPKGQQPARKRKRATEEQVPQKKMRKNNHIPESQRGKDKTPLPQSKKEKPRNPRKTQDGADKDEDRNQPQPLQHGLAAEANASPQCQRCCRKRKKDLEAEEVSRKRLRRENETCWKKQRGETGKKMTTSSRNSSEQVGRPGKCPEPEARPRTEEREHHKPPSAPQDQGEAGQQQEGGAQQQEGGAQQQERGVKRKARGTPQQERGAKRQARGAQQQEGGAQQQEGGAQQQEGGAKQQEKGVKRKARGTPQQERGAKRQAREAQQQEGGAQGKVRVAQQQERGAQ